MSRNSSATLDSMRVVRKPQFLPQQERDQIFAALCANSDAFRPPGNSGEGGSLYLPLETREADRPGAEPVRQVSHFLVSHIRDLLPYLFPALQMEPFEVKEVPLTFIVGHDGHSGLPHADSIDGRYRTSLLYYLHNEPRAFRGGDLEFFSAEPESPTGHSEKAVARLEFRDNLLIAFPSETVHSITDVHSDSSEFPDGRFAAVGFLGPQ